MRFALMSTYEVLAQLMEDMCTHLRATEIGKAMRAGPWPDETRHGINSRFHLSVVFVSQLAAVDQPVGRGINGHSRRPRDVGPLGPEADMGCCLVWSALTVTQFTVI